MPFTPLNRRTFLQTGLAASIATPVLAALRQDRLDEAAEVLTRATSQGQVAAAVLHVVQGKSTFSRAFGKAKSADATETHAGRMLLTSPGVVSRLVMSTRELPDPSWPRLVPRKLTAPSGVPWTRSVSASAASARRLVPPTAGSWTRI